MPPCCVSHSDSIMAIRRAAATYMEASEVYRLLTPRIRRGRVISRILIYASVICFLAAVVGRSSWALTAGSVGVLSYMLSVHVGKRNAAAKVVSENPRSVYWAHATSVHDPFI